MRVLLGCEESGTIREAFRSRGHEAFSCDLKPARDNSPFHFQNDIFQVINEGWDLLIAHPPCTYLTLTANKWLRDQPARKSGALVGEERRRAQKDAIDFFIRLDKINIKKKCLENPMGVISTAYRKPDQIIHPYFFGDEAQKLTCLWLTNLPKLFHAKQVDLFNDKVTHVGKGEMLECKSGNKMPKWYAFADKSQGQDKRAEIRSKTFEGIAIAMAEQWG